MSARLTSWKEIAHYLGKGIRTVQRWESVLGLPVRRPSAKDKGIVFALTEELDAWLLSQNSGHRNKLGAELEKLRASLAQLTAENQRLAAELEQYRQSPQNLAPETPHQLVQRSERLIEDTRKAAQMFAETSEMSKNLSVIRRGLK